MNGDRQFERNLPGILTDLGAGPAPDYTDLLLARTGGSRQRPAWVFPERWLPMDTVARPAASTRLPSLRLVALVGSALLLVGAIVAIALVAGSRRELPPAFGLAGNGLVAWADEGRIVVADPVARTSQVIATDSADRPRFSPDGTRLAWLRKTPRIDIVVANADGTSPVVVTAESMIGLRFFEWSPDGRSLVVTDSRNRILRFDAARPSEPTVVVAEGDRDIGGDWNNQVASIFRPPDGRQIAYLGLVRGAEALMVANADGTSAQAIVAPGGDLRYLDLLWPSWSPDGSTIAFTAAAPETPDLFHAYLVNADGTGLRRLAAHPENPSDGMPVWSPVGKSIAMQRWYETPDGVDVRPITIVDVASGEVREVGPVSINGFLSYGWSPDGRSIIYAPDATHEVLVVDVATGNVVETGLTAGSGLSWQRVAR